MPDTTRSTFAGLDAPSRRGKRSFREGTGVVNGTPQSEGGIAQPSVGIEDAPRAEPERLGGFPVIDPLNIPGDAESGGDHQPKRRGRPRGSTNKKEEAISDLKLLKIEDLLITLCFFAGNLASSPELYATPEEASKVADAYREFAKYHESMLTDKRLSEVNLTLAVGAFAAPRVIAIWNRPKKAQTAKPSAVPIRETVEPVYRMPAVAPEVAQVPSQIWNESGETEAEEA